MNIREARWEKIEGYIGKLESMRNVHKWVFIAPSVKGGFDALSLPFPDYYKKANDVLKRAIEINEVIGRNHDIKTVSLKTYSCIQNDQILKIANDTEDPAACLSTMLWAMIAFFASTGNSVEIFEEEKVVFLDINLIEVKVDNEKGYSIK